MQADAQHPWSTKDRSKPSHTASTSPKLWESTRHRGFRQPTDWEFSSSSTRNPFPLPCWTARSCLLSQEFEGREADAFLGIQPLKRDASSPPSPSPAGRRCPPTTHVPKSRAASLREGIQQHQRAGEIVPNSQEPERGRPIASTEAARAWKTEQEGGNRHTAALRPPPAHGAPPPNHVALFQTRLAFTLTRAGLPRLI